MSELRACSVRFAFSNGLPLIRDASFVIKSGETIVLLGRNACGKTTLLRLLAGLILPQSGAVEIDGFPVADNRKRVGILFQNPDHQMIAPTVEEEIALGLELRGVEQKEMQRRVDEMICKFHLSDLRKRSPETLSGGQKQRTALAAIMIQQPDFLLFDEPESYLDGISRREFMTAVAEIRQSVGLLWTTPNMKNCPNCDRILYLSEGSVREVSMEELSGCLCIENDGCP